LSDSFKPVQPDEAENDRPDRNKKEMEKVREILFGSELNELSKIKQRLDDPHQRVQDISDLLPEAIVKSAKKDGSLTKALMPNVEEAVRVSVKKESKTMVDALFPKSVSETLSGMIQALNETLENSLSIQGMKWRFEALRTGKSFAEVVMLHTLVYRVEQVFLIHKETGLLLQHIVGENVDTQDGDMVSSMLTAIQDFVRDSFKVGEDESLQNLQVGDLTVWIEPTPTLVLAGVIHGRPPAELRNTFQDTLENIYLEHSDSLGSFDGDTSEFDRSRKYLDECLVQKKVEPEKKSFLFAYVILGAIFIGLITLITLNQINRNHWENYFEALRNEPGIVLTSIDMSFGHYYITGLNDPLARDPADILLEQGLKPEKIHGQWEMYYSISPEFAVKRANMLLKPSEKVTLRFSKGVLAATGEASLEWIEDARSLAMSIPGIHKYDDGYLRNIETEKINAIIVTIEKPVLKFKLNSSEILPGQDDVLSNIRDKLNEFVSLAEKLKREYHIIIEGRADSTGFEDRNILLSIKRARKIETYLKNEGFEENIFKIEGLGSSKPLKSEEKDRERALNRSVMLKVEFND
jgi:outer membrane protein OmpA-like peptidoglycan-associated protein